MARGYQLQSDRDLTQRLFFLSSHVTNTLSSYSVHPVMRNLSLASSEIVIFPGASVCATAIDLDQNVLYAASERQNPDNDVEVEIWKIGLNPTDGMAEASSIVHFYRAQPVLCWEGALHSTICLVEI